MTHNHPGRRTSVVALLAAAALATTAGCSDDSGSAAAATGTEPNTLDAAKVAAQTAFDRFSGGDFAGAWELHTTKAKQTISREDYVRLNETCARKGLAIQLTSARLDGTGRAIVIARQLVAAQAYVMVYEDGAWRLEPTRDGLALYAKGPAQAIAAQRAAGTCANA